MKTKIKVNLVGFGDKGIRFVDIELPNDENRMSQILGEIFRLGQNDFHPKDVRSVSVGDIIELKFKVENVGFSLISERE